jgi:hypothetical protein
MNDNLPGRLVAAGSFGVVLASGFYAAAPLKAALPAPVLDVALAMAETARGATLLRAAGTVGLAADLALIVGALLTAGAMLQRERLRAAAGWAGLALATLIFVHVDALAAAVLPAMTVSPGSGTSGWEAVRRLFDVLWLLGGTAFGVSTLLVAEGSGARTWLLRVSALAVLGGVAGILAGQETALVMGLGLALGCLAFGFEGLRQTDRQPVIAVV